MQGNELLSRNLYVQVWLRGFDWTTAVSFGELPFFFLWRTVLGKLKEMKPHAISGESRASM